MTRILGIDVGEARIGLALSDELGMLAHPLETLKTKDGAPFPAIAAVVAREKVDTIVVGLPRNMDGTYGPAAEKVRAFVEQLRALLPPDGPRIQFWDERLTTVAAQKQLHEAGRNVKNSRAVIDQAAAALILQGFLDRVAGMPGGF